MYSKLRAVRCPQLPVILNLIRQESCLEVHEEYIRGKTLEQIRRETGALDDDTLLAVATDVCRALTVLHGMQPPIVHRDVKPENILRREDGGLLTVRTEGVFCVTAVAFYGGKPVEKVKTTVMATDTPAAYEACNCVVERLENDIPYSSSLELPKDGSPLTLPMRIDERYDRRFCTASAHKAVFWMEPQILRAPEGLTYGEDYGITGEYRFYTYKPGEFELYMPGWFGGEIEARGITVCVSE